MARATEPPPRQTLLRRHWPWLLLGVIAAVAAWHAFDIPDGVDDEFPRVARPTFSRFAPPAYRLAEPGDTIDRVAIYVSSLAAVLSLCGLRSSPGGRRPWASALAVSGAAFWYAANPGPTFDGWHGLGWRAAFDPSAPSALRVALASAFTGLAGLTVWGLKGRTSRERVRGVGGLLAAAGALTLVRVFEFPDPEPMGYWPRWAFVGALVAFSAALLKRLPTPTPRAKARRVALAGGAGLAAWSALVFAGVWLTWYHRPLERLRAVVPGRIFISAMPTGKGLEVAQARHHFRTIINLFPENTPLRSPRLPQEMGFVRRHGLRYVGSPGDVAASDAFLDETLRLAQDPSAWPILVHCHGCMDRTPAWVGIYRFVVEGRPLAEVFRFIEGHRGFRPKASVTLLYNRVLPRLAPERYGADPTAPLLRRCAEGTVDPFHALFRAEVGAANPGASAGVRGEGGTASAAPVPSLTPRR